MPTLEHRAPGLPGALLTTPGQVVVDPFGGSGTLIVAADALGRRARLVELDPAYCDVIRQRYADHANRPDLAP